MDFILAIVLIIAVGSISGIAAFFMGVNHRRKTAEAEIGSAEAEAQRIVNDAYKEAEAKKKEAVLEAKDEIHRQRDASEKELNERRREIQRQERRIQSKEETLDKKIENLEKKEDKLAKKQKAVENEYAEAERIKNSHLEVLESISGYTKEQAKNELLRKLDQKLNHEKAVKIMEYEQRVKDEADKKARNIISMAIQRCASDYVAEATVSVVQLPNDEMKGRIIE